MTISPAAAPQSVQTVIADAARRTGADFSYLLATARRESGMDPSAQAPTSSAAGLFQFIEQTWLGMVKRHGAGHGMAAEAAQIRESGGRFSIADPAARQRILDLRFDPAAASAMAAEYTAESADYLSARFGRAPTQQELYTAHFLGPAGAARLIETAERDPGARADALFPEAARANRSIFRSGGAPASVAQVLEKLGAMHGGDASAPALRGGRGAARNGAVPDAFIRMAAETEAAQHIQGGMGGGFFGVIAGAASSAGALSRGTARVLSPLVIEALAMLESPGRAKRKS